MRRLAGIVALLLLLSGAAPVLACVTTVAMDHQESACCRAMHGNCGEMAKLGCCQTEVRTDGQPQIPAAAQSFDPHWVMVNWVTPEPVASHLLTSSFLDVPPEHSPPGLLAMKLTVLRI